MKGLTHIITVILLSASVFMSAFLVSCKEDDMKTEKIAVNNVFLFNSDSTTGIITKAQVGTLIRIDGVGFGTAKAVYCNGKKILVNPNFVTDNSILMVIPSDLPVGTEVKDESARNTIRVVTQFDDFSIPFLILAPPPVVTGVSHSLPKVGETIDIYGSNFRDLQSLTFPGGVVLTPDQFDVDITRTKITCKVPPGSTSTPGAILVVSGNGAANSHNFMNRTECVFIKNFANDANVPAPYNQRCYNFGESVTYTISGNQTATLPAIGNPANPATYRQFPATPNTAAAGSTQIGGFHFRPDVAAGSVINTSNGVVTGLTSCNNLALQFDIYIPVEWSSGYIRVELISGNVQYRYDYAPWAAGNGAVKPVKMTGWQTVTIPMATFSGLTSKTLDYFIQQAKAKDAIFFFYNSTYTDSGGKAYPATAISNFQISFGNFRIVTYSKPPVPK